MKMHTRTFESDLDLDAVVLLHIETEEALGGAMDMPNLDGRPVLECRVLEKDGVIIGGYYMEAVAEFVMFGRDPEATAVIQRETREIAERLKQRGLRICRTMVPSWLGRDLASVCEELEDAGFQPTDRHYKHFIYHLQKPAHVAPSAIEQSAAVLRCVE